MRRIHLWVFGVSFLVGIIGGFLFSEGRAEPSKPDASMTVVLENYFKIQEALASDTTTGVGEAAGVILKAALKVEVLEPKNFGAKLKKSALLLSKEKELKGARARFKDLSGILVEWGKIRKPAGIQIAFCSMAGAGWLQKEGSLRNPYYGKEMLECGEVEKTK